MEPSSKASCPIACRIHCCAASALSCDDRSSRQCRPAFALEAEPASPRISRSIFLALCPHHSDQFRSATMNSTERRLSVDRTNLRLAPSSAKESSTPRQSHHPLCHQAAGNRALPTAEDGDGPPAAPQHRGPGTGLLQPFSSTQSHDTLDIIQNVRTHILDFHAAAHVNSVGGVCQWHEYDATFVVNHRRR
jgi:hypothetical protein